MENKDWAYQIIDNDAIKMNNGDNMVDVSTAYLAIDRARSDERHQLLAGWEPTTKSVPTTGLVDVLFSDGTIRKIVGDKICNFITYWFTVTYNVYQRAVLNLVSFWYHYITFVIISLNFISYIFLLYF